jgi:hypothetical protein
MRAMVTPSDIKEQGTIIMAMPNAFEQNLNVKD